MSRGSRIRPRCFPRSSGSIRLAAQKRRDAEDAGRAVGPLAAAPDAIQVATDGLALEQVVDRLELLAHAQR